MTLRHIAPRRTSPETPQDAIDYSAVVDAFNSTAIGRQKRCDEPILRRSIRGGAWQTPFKEIESHTANKMNPVYGDTA